MKHETILGVRFLVGSAESVVACGLAGGLVVVPSAPVLVSMARSLALREAVIEADLAVADSGLMVLLWRLFRGRRIERVSGLEYLKLLLEKLAAENNKLTAESQYRTHANVLWIMPSEGARDRNLAWLRAKGHFVTVDDCFIAPRYPRNGRLADDDLLSWVWKRRPRHIIICLGGGVQERLGYFLARGLEERSKMALERIDGQPSGAEAVSPQDMNSLPAYDSPSTIISERGPYTSLPSNRYCRPGIHCIGAAIGFLSGEQVRIPVWADYLYLGWFCRCLSAPRQYLPRYWNAARLIPLIWRYGGNAPPV